MYKFALFLPEKVSLEDSRHQVHCSPLSGHTSNKWRNALQWQIQGQVSYMKQLCSGPACVNGVHREMKTIRLHKATYQLALVWVKATYSKCIMWFINSPILCRNEGFLDLMCFQTRSRCINIADWLNSLWRCFLGCLTLRTCLTLNVIYTQAECFWIATWMQPNGALFDTLLWMKTQTKTIV